MRREIFQRRASGLNAASKNQTFLKIPETFGTGELKTIIYLLIRKYIPTGRSQLDYMGITLALGLATVPLTYLKIPFFWIGEDNYIASIRQKNHSCSKQLPCIKPHFLSKKRSRALLVGKAYFGSVDHLIFCEKKIPREYTLKIESIFPVENPL